MQTYLDKMTQSELVKIFMQTEEGIALAYHYSAKEIKTMAEELFNKRCEDKRKNFKTQERKMRTISEILSQLSDEELDSLTVAFIHNYVDYIRLERINENKSNASVRDQILKLIMAQGWKGPSVFENKTIPEIMDLVLRDKNSHIKYLRVSLGNIKHHTDINNNEINAALKYRTTE